jgi:hypothetical protein
MGATGKAKGNRQEAKPGLGTGFSLCRSQSGQTVVEWAILYSAVMMPLTFALIFTSEMLWVWHTVGEMTRDGARYAATHCWDGSGSNVQTYMRSHVPLVVDMDQFQSGPAEIQVQYFSRNAESGALEEFSCDQGECSVMCVPDVVTVQVTNYTFRRLLSYLGLPGVPLPDFRTTVPVESAGCDPEQGTCLP